MKVKKRVVGKLLSPRQSLFHNPAAPPWRVDPASWRTPRSAGRVWRKGSKKRNKRGQQRDLLMSSSLLIGASGT